MLIRTRESRAGLLTKVYRSVAGLWFPEFDHFAAKHRNVLAVLGTPEGTRLIPASNIVTNAGDLHYAQRAVAETLTNAFGIHEMCTAGTPGKAATRGSFTPVTASQKATAATYPLRNDADGDNTGAGADIVTHLVSYTTGDWDSASEITHGIITNSSPGGSEPILTGYAFATGFTKTASDTLKVFVNHEMSGQ